MGIFVREKRGKLYLDIRHKGKRHWESLGLTIGSDESMNAETMHAAELIRHKREIQLALETHGAQDDSDIPMKQGIVSKPSSKIEILLPNNTRFPGACYFYYKGRNTARGYLKVSGSIKQLELLGWKYRMLIGVARIGESLFLVPSEEGNSVQLRYWRMKIWIPELVELAKKNKTNSVHLMLSVTPDGVKMDPVMPASEK